MRRRLLMLLCLAPAAAFAQAEEIENPGSVAAVQERPYKMNHELLLGVGSLPLDAFNKAYFGHVSYTYHFSDWFAWQVGRGFYAYNVSTGLKGDLETKYNVQPTAFPTVQYGIGSDLLLSPFYGKTSVLNRWVLHFESYFILGGTVFNVDIGGARAFQPAANVGAGLRLFQNKYVSYRLDVTDDIVISTKPYNVAVIQLAAALNFGVTGEEAK